MSGVSSEGVEKLLRKPADGQKNWLPCASLKAALWREMRKRHARFSSANVRVLLCRARGAVKKYFAKDMNTDVNTVKKLLAKYYAGESTIDEERGSAPFL